MHQSYRGPVNRWVTLGVLCLAVFTIMVGTMIVNILLPTMVRDLDATTRDLLWIVDGFNLVFAALVLAAGSLSDRFGRKGALIAGLTIYSAASLASAYAPDPNWLIAGRAVAGLGAAVVFPTTLSIISNVFPDRRERARAISLWGAASGASVAIGPVIGGALVEKTGWGGAFVFCALVGALTLVLSFSLVPTSRDPQAPRLDFLGLVLSVATLGLLVYTIIEAPDKGWASHETLQNFATAAVLALAFGLWENQVRDPMMDIRLFANMRFTAASGSVTLCFFALFGFIFLITQYSQFILGWGVLEAGARQIPVALAVAIFSLIGMPIAVRIGSKIVVCFGMAVLCGDFFWIARDSWHTSYTVIVGQMVLFGIGMGLTSTIATEAIMGVVPAAKAGIGSAVNDATRELGGTIGVAVIGSVSLSIYRAQLDRADIQPGPLHVAREGLGAAAKVAGQSNDPGLLRTAQSAFLDGLAVGCWVAAGVCAFGVLLAARYLPAHPEAALGAAVDAWAEIPPLPYATSVLLGADHGAQADERLLLAEGLADGDVEAELGELDGQPAGVD
jgi:EmrB/QacA subfamily drug resistance transporter